MTTTIPLILPTNANLQPGEYYGSWVFVERSKWNTVGVSVHMKSFRVIVSPCSDQKEHLAVN